MDNKFPELESQYNNLDLSNKEFGPESEEAEILKSTISSLMTEVIGKYPDIEEELLEKSHLGKKIFGKIIDESEVISIKRYDIYEDKDFYYITADITPKNKDEFDKYSFSILMIDQDITISSSSILKDDSVIERKFSYTAHEECVNYEKKRFVNN